MQRLLLAALLGSAGAGVHAATLEVGAGKAYATLAAAAAAARDGDTVLISAGTYTQGAVWNADNLVIKRAADAPPQSVIITGGTVLGKGLFVTRGDNIRIDGLRFENARVPDGNGAGIRAEGVGLTVRNSKFTGNEMGILATAGNQGLLRVEKSIFDLTRSQASGRIGHAIYADAVAELQVTASTFRRGATGHYIKSRAPVSSITGNSIDDTYGSASYLIEIAEGGKATISGNSLIKGANAANCCVAIAYGSEMYKGGSYVNPPGDVVISDNSFTSKRNSTVYFAYNFSRPPNPLALINNSLTAEAGRIVALFGPGTVSNPRALLPALAMTDGMAAFMAGPDAPGDAADAQLRLEAVTDVSEPGWLALFGLSLLGLTQLQRSRRQLGKPRPLA